MLCQVGAVIFYFLFYCLFFKRWRLKLHPPKMVALKQEVSISIIGDIVGEIVSNKLIERFACALVA